MAENVRDLTWWPVQAWTIEIMMPEHEPFLNAIGSEPDWRRIFPDADHKWVMGLRRSDAAAFFAPRDPTGRVRVERDRWLTEAPETYAALTPAAEPSLADTVDLARELGATIDPSLPRWQQLLTIGRTWEADFVWMHPDEAGVHRLTGGVVCFPSSWALQDKLGRTMSETHGPVPGLNAALDRQIETFFARMTPGVGWTRENANYSRVPDLNQHPSRSMPPLDANVVGDEFWIRLEHQFLLKLAASRSILFAIRVEAIPLRELLKSAQGSSGLARLLDTIPAEAAKYKGVAQARDVIIPILRSAGTATNPRAEAPDPRSSNGVVR